MVDPGRLRRLLEALAEYRNQLERLRDAPVAEYRGERHVYEKVDDRIVHSSLRTGLQDFSAFSQAIARLAERG
jgi:hypothetical protein